MSEKTIKYKTHPEIVLGKILKNYPMLEREKIEFFSQYFHPIAEITMDIYEKSYEEFEMVELFVLKLIRQRIAEDRNIAAISGLELNYVRSVMLVLEGYGHVKDGIITNLGETSVAVGKKVQLHHVKQKFQCDAVNLNILKNSRKISESKIYGEGETSTRYPHLPYYKGDLLQDDLTITIEKENLNEFRKLNNSAQSNIIEITDVTVDRLFFTEAFLMKYQELNEILIFTQIYDSSKNKMADRFTYRLFGLSENNSFFPRELTKDTPIYRVESKKIIKNMYALIRENILESKDKFIENANDLVKEIYPFEQLYIDITMVKNDEIEIEIVLHPDAIKKFHKNLFVLLSSFVDGGNGYMAVRDFQGLIVRFINRDDKFGMIIEKYHYSLKYMDATELKDKIQTHFRKMDEEENVYDFLYELIDFLSENGKDQIMNEEVI